MSLVIMQGIYVVLPKFETMCMIYKQKNNFRLFSLPRNTINHGHMFTFSISLILLVFILFDIKKYCEKTLRYPGFRP